VTALNAPTRRVATAVALAAGATLTLSACGAGQITQTSSQVAAVNGNSATVGDIAIRNAHVIFPDSEEYSIEAGGTALLGFTIVNLDGYTPDVLTGISTDFAGSVVGAEDLTIPASGAVVAGVSSATAATDESVDESPQPANPEGDTPIVPTVETVEMVDLTEDVRPGLTIPVTFTFAEHGDVTVSVPVDAGPELDRHESELSPIIGEAH